MAQSRSHEQWMSEVARTRVPEGMAAVWFLGQESVILKGKETVIYIDPFISGTLSEIRTFAPPFPPEAIDTIDVCLITHEHIDHLDPETVRVLARTQPGTRYVAPACCRELLTDCGVQPERITDAMAGEWLDIGSAEDPIRLLPVSAAHEVLERNEQGYDRYVGYVLQMNGLTIYHAGDTVIYDGLAETLREQRIDLGLLPINGGDYYRRSQHIVGNMDYREAAELAVAAEIETVVPLHYDMFAGNSEKPGHFVQYLYEQYPEQKCHVMARFERYLYASDKAFL
ncbi:MBL fold metallo-hydrolase [Paenibacillus sp. 1P07SE]|uniref:MBL fold metallo-hydrolase n=1 Tax=Paenibacillus sp. 1P07SE TaxID=3132209 RepID=UPI0039A62946